MIFENLYVGCRLGERLSARLGRQNLARGDGFLLADGTPGDGSRTTYVDALDLAWAARGSKLELVAIANPYRDLHLPVVHDRKRKLIEWDELALGLYYANTGFPGTDLEAYYFYKTETDDVRPPTDASFQSDRRLHTLGGRVGRRTGGGWSVTGELAGQAGAQDPHTDILAWGACVSGEKAFGHPARPSLSVGYIGLSGDDPASARNEGWDPLFSRWPKWSELYVYTLATEKGGAYWTNLSAWQAEFLITPVAPLEVRATYYRLGAFHRLPGQPSLFAGGLVRGDLYELRADVRINSRLRGHVVGEYLDPGGFHRGADGAWFLRLELIGSFRKAFAL